MIKKPNYTIPYIHPHQTVNSDKTILKKTIADGFAAEARSKRVSFIKSSRQKKGVARENPKPPVRS